MPADFDGDSKGDAAVFRPSTATWYINRSTGGTSIQQFGADGDRPVADDFDGDGKRDIAVFRPSLGQWWLSRSSDGADVSVVVGGDETRGSGRQTNSRYAFRDRRYSLSWKSDVIKIPSPPRKMMIDVVSGIVDLWFDQPANFL